MGIYTGLQWIWGILYLIVMLVLSYCAGIFFVQKGEGKITDPVERFLIGFGTWFLSGTGSTYYYTQIDNGRIREISSSGGVIDLHGGMSYSYTLRAYDENGNDKEITFGTSRELKEKAFLRLTVMPVRGVLEWSEVNYDELPAAIQVKYTAPEF